MSSINLKKLPKHIAIIMDGNGRWAVSRGLDRVEGHRVGVNRSEDIITAASELGVGYLTLYAFSKENWQRPQGEIDALMVLLRNFLLEKREKMLQNGIRLNAIGDMALLPSVVCDTLRQVIQDTSQGRGMVLTLALSYGARDEILRAMKKAAGDLKTGFADLKEEQFSGYLDTAFLPDPDLIIRTSGEYRISNFLLWQGAYAEYVFEECNWPDFTRDRMLAAIEEYQNRERRFGKTSEQL